MSNINFDLFFLVKSDDEGQGDTIDTPDQDVFSGDIICIQDLGDEDQPCH